MTMNRDLSKEYFDWMCDLVCEGSAASFDKLLKHLHEIEFTYVIPRDSNRAEDGIELRYQFAYDLLDNPRRELGGPCTILEMMVALAIRCEGFMDDPTIGDRTGQWFWGMITSLGLGYMTDDKYDEEEVDYIVDRFLDRDYEPDGKGGLFRIRNYQGDLRESEIWNQLCYYLDTLG